MNHRQLRLALGLFFLVVGTALLVVRFWYPDIAQRIGPPHRLFLITLFALVMGGLNVARWYVAYLHFQRRATPVRTPLQPEREGRAPAEYNPEFDFDRAPNKNA
jgi:hypothetical protein